MLFTKLHGCGNDYVFVDCFAQSVPSDPAGLSREISDRHCGVGSDGLILILPSAIADARMRMFNADGSEGAMCGNGVRCVAKYIHDHGIARHSPLRIETGRGVLTLTPTYDQVGRVQAVRVDMGEPILDADRIPAGFPASPIVDAPPPSFLSAGRDIPDLLSDAGATFRLTCVSMGNPHAVLYCRDVGRIPLEVVGPLLEVAPFFPDRANIHFVQPLARSAVRMRTWERGSGITLACGTGACAVAVAGVLTGRTDRRLLAHLPGGDLELDWSESDNHVYMTGPAVEVFTGDWPTDAPNGRSGP